LENKHPTLKLIDWTEKIGPAQRRILRPGQSPDLILPIAAEILLPPGYLQKEN
jgi:hypothetical protein